MAVYNYGKNKNKWGSLAVVVNGSGYADPLAASALAAKGKAPLLFTNSNTVVAPEIVTWLNNNSIQKIAVIGGPNAVSDTLYNTLGPASKRSRVYGNDRYGTSAAIGEWGLGNGYFSNSTVGFVRGDTWVDALCAGPVQGHFGGQLYYVNCENNTYNAYVFLTALGFVGPQT